MADVAVADVQRRDPQREGRREHEQRHDRERIEPQLRQLEPWPEIAMNARSTADCSTKSKSATPTADSGRISRGNAIFFTRLALSITDREPVWSELARSSTP